MSSTSTSTEGCLPVYDTVDPGLWREGVAAPSQNGSPQEWSETPQQQIPVPVSSNGTVSGFYNGLSFNSNGNITGNQHTNGSHAAGGYAMNGVRLPNNLAYPHSMINGNGYVNPIANAPYLRAPGWVVTKKVTNGVKKQKRNRTAFTTQQMMELEQEYARARYLDRNRRIELSEALNLNQRTIKIWFQNRRMKEKKDRAESLEEANHSNSTKSSPELIEDTMPMLMHEQYPLNVGPNDVYNLRGVYMDQYQLQGTFPPTPAQPQIQSFVEYAPESQYEAQPQCKQVHLQEDNYEPTYNNGLEVPQLPQDPTPLNRCSTASPAESNWDLSWIRNITIDEEIHGN